MMLSVGDSISWLWFILMLVIVTNVVMRYLFGMGRIEFEEVQWHIYATGFLVGLSYAYVSDSHIRVDIVRLQLPFILQVWIEFYGTLLLLLPFIILVLVAAIPFVYYAFETSEVSASPGGLKYRWLIKSMLIVGFGLLFVAMLARLSRLGSFLFGWPAEYFDGSQQAKQISINDQVNK
ncbi:MAG: TRAP transporter small permease subunit [Pseudomonadales bacterium]|nr:TRAP transporter small permease subunit [Pseudomonadales bacterium]